MTLTIGRIPAFADPMHWSNAGDQVQFDGRLSAGSSNAALILRDQLLGYHLNPDEPVIPIISTADSRLNGFYRIAAVDVPTTPTMFLATGVIEYVVQATRIGAYQSTYLEGFLTGALMVNSSAITTTAEPFHAFGNASEYTINVSGYTVENRAVADGSGTVIWARMNPTAAAPTYKALARWTQTPANYYAGACQLRSALPADHVVVGLQDAPQADNWTLRNGLVSLTVTPGSNWTLLWADATNTYRTTTTTQLYGGASIGSWLPTAGGFIKIMRNAPEECIIRVPLSPSATTGWPPSSVTAFGYTPAYLDIAIRRGSRIVRFYLTASGAVTWRWGHAAGASSAITGGLVSTANDAFGNRIGIFSALASTNDLPNGRFTLNASVAAADFGITMELAGTTSVNRDTIASQFLQYLGGAGGSQAERMQVVAR